MVFPVCVLLFGNDAHLLESRRMVLECAGCKVYVATRLLTLNLILADKPIDLLILCHSLSTEECERVKSVVQGHSPKVKVLTLTAGDFPPCIASGDRMVSTGGGPKALLNAVDQITGKIPPSSEAGVRRQAMGGRR
jgi:hypothetical protein